MVGKTSYEKQEIPCVCARPLKEEALSWKIMRIGALLYYVSERNGNIKIVIYLGGKDGFTASTAAAFLVAGAVLYLFFRPNRNLAAGNSQSV